VKALIEYIKRLVEENEKLKKEYKRALEYINNIEDEVEEMQEDISRAMGEVSYWQGRAAEAEFNR
jgi:hypothetical protein